MIHFKYRQVNDWWRRVGVKPALVKIELSQSEIRYFLKKNESIFYSDGKYHKIDKITKIKHFSVLSIIREIDLREYNLETLLC